MKKIFFSLISLFFVSIILTSCSKDDSASPPATKPDGVWKGTGQYGTAPGGASYAFTLTFKSDGTITIIGDNSTAIDTATGNWQMVQDSVHATYKYVASSAIYILSAKFTTNATVMAGTIGLQPAVTGVGIFSVTKQ